MSDAGPDGVKTTAGARRLSSRLVSAVAALLLLGGGAAVAYGLLHQQAAPPAPSAAAAGTLEPAPTPSPSTAAPHPATRSTARPSTPPTAATTPAVLPESIRIPAIKVSSALTVVGQHGDGTLEVPQPGPDYDKAAWFKGSPAPGQTGPAVIEGHVDGKINGPSVFYRLGALKPGNEVLVTRKNGTSVRFVVYAVRLFPKDAFPRLTVYGNTAGPELRLITCGGSFDRHRAAGGYTGNVVVFARQS